MLSEKMLSSASNKKENEKEISKINAPTISYMK